MVLNKLIKYGLLILFVSFSSLNFAQPNDSSTAKSVTSTASVNDAENIKITLNTSVKQQVKNAYQNASIVLIIFIIITGLLVRFYIRQLNYRKASQHKVEQALAVAQDARDEAEKLAEAKINFLARMSHEIRTPMNGVLGMAESLTFTKLTSQQKDLLGTLTDSAESLLVLLNDILDFAKMDAGKLILESKPVDLQALAQRAINGFNHLQKEKSVSLRLTIDYALHTIYWTDSLRLMQVLNNLLSNAVKFTGQGQIHLSMFLVSRTKEGDNFYDTIKISVKDTGIGINEKQQQQLFSPFIQADSAVTRKYGGTGLGLSICQEIVNAMGSNIAIESEVNAGSEFAFNLTLKQAKSTEYSLNGEQAHHSNKTNNDEIFSPLKVLMAEDNLVNIKVLSAQLKRLNITPDIAENGQQALALCDKNDYDVVISDCHMPIVDGYELASSLAKKKVGRSPWLIAITADALEGTAEKCFKAGFDDYIAKPCTQKTITDKMHRALKKVTVATIESKVEPLTSPYHLFNPSQLLNGNGQDIVLCKNIARVFVDMWHQDKKSLISATKELDFHHIFALVHRLKGSIRYLGNEAIECNAVLIQKQAQGLQKESIQYTIKLFMRELDLLSKEVDDWLRQ